MSGEAEVVWAREVQAPLERGRLGKCRRGCLIGCDMRGLFSRWGPSGEYDRHSSFPWSSQSGEERPRPGSGLRGVRIELSLWSRGTAGATARGRREVRGPVAAVGEGRAVGNVAGRAG